MKISENSDEEIMIAFLGFIDFENYKNFNS